MLRKFRKIVQKIPFRLVITLNMYAENYFVKNSSRSIKPLGGTNKRIPTNKLIKLYKEEDLSIMQEMVKNLTLETMKKKYSQEENQNTCIYIDESLFKIPLPIGDRSETVQDLSSTLMGTRFPVEGEIIRLFLQWGNGLPAQHLDMDLSCRVAYEDGSDFCSYSQLVIPGCKHSGDIQYIPHKVGTAEYIDIDMSVLADRGAKYVTFTCNAYSNGSITPNLVVGWMNSQYPMKISRSGLAYNPVDVQHQVRITNTLSKGLVFGTLDVEKREVIWLEMSFDGQLTSNLDLKGIEVLLQKLDAKIKIGEILQLKAEAQNLTLVNEKDKADEVYDHDWVLDMTKVTKCLID